MMNKNIPQIISWKLIADPEGIKNELDNELSVVTHCCNCRNSETLIPVRYGSNDMINAQSKICMGDEILISHPITDHPYVQKLETELNLLREWKECIEEVANEKNSCCEQVGYIEAKQDLLEERLYELEKENENI